MKLKQRLTTLLWNPILGPRDGNQVSDEKWMKSPVNLLATHPESNQGNWVSDMKLPGLCEHWTTMIRHFIGLLTEIALPPTVKKTLHFLIAFWFAFLLIERYVITDIQFIS